jgi:hypothetical protein
MSAVKLVLEASKIVGQQSYTSWLQTWLCSMMRIAAGSIFGEMDLSRKRMCAEENASFDWLQRALELGP